jgi:chromosome segregation ATPase
MSSRAALKALGTMGDGALSKAARRASAVGRLQDKRQRARDARQQAADDAKAAQEQAAEDAKAAAEAIAEAAEKERAAQESVRAAIEETASSYRSFASIATTTTDDVAAAQDKLTAAQDAVTEARRKFDLAGNDRDRAAAARELADAEKAAAEAQKERNNVTDNPTSSSIRANMAGKLTRLKGFAAAVKQLKANGLNATTLADILSMGPDAGYDYAKALLDGGLGDINAVQADITATSADLGLFGAGVNAASATAIGLANAAAGGLRVDLVPAPVTLEMNGHVVATALLEYQRQTGR